MVDEFYDTGENKGRIKGVAAAHELADLEANKGVNAALAREGVEKGYWREDGRTWKKNLWQ